MLKKKELKELTSDKVEKEVEEGETSFHCTVIRGNTFLEGLTIKDRMFFWDSVFGGNLSFYKTTLGDLLDIRWSVIKGTLDFRGTTIKDLRLTGVVIKGSLIFGESIINGFLSLEGTTINGVLAFSTQKGPSMIFVNSEKMAQRIHLAAPTVPITIRKEESLVNFDSYRPKEG